MSESSTAQRMHCESCQRSVLTEEWESHVQAHRQLDVPPSGGRTSESSDSSGESSSSNNGESVRPSRTQSMQAHRQESKKKKKLKILPDVNKLADTLVNELYHNIAANQSRSTLSFKAARCVPQLTTREIEGIFTAVHRYKTRREDELRLKARLEYDVERAKMLQSKSGSNTAKRESVSQSSTASICKFPPDTVAKSTELSSGWR